MTAAAIATMATVEAATITAVSCPFACSQKRKRRAVRARVRARLAKPSQHHESAWSTTLHDHNPEAGRAALDQQAADLNPPWPLDELLRSLTAADGSARASGETSAKEQPESVSSLLCTRSSHGATPRKMGFVRC
jgi:hypothetical protein